MRVFLDTNVLVSALATRGLCADVLRRVAAKHQLIASETVLHELRRVLRDKFRIPKDTIEATDRFLRREAVVIREAPSLGIELRDPCDVPVLEEAVAGKANVLVTGDGDLLESTGQVPLTVITPRGFWEASNSNGG